MIPKPILAVLLLSGGCSTSARCCSTTTAGEYVFGTRQRMAEAESESGWRIADAPDAANNMLACDDVQLQPVGALYARSATQQLAAADHLGVGHGDGLSECALAESGEVVGWPSGSPRTLGRAARPRCRGAPAHRSPRSERPPAPRSEALDDSR